jgi:hypothetical protein
MELVRNDHFESADLGKVTFIACSMAVTSV